MQASGVILKNSLKKHTLFYNLIDDIVQKIQSEIKAIDKLRLDVELTLLICNLIENSIATGNKFDINKKQLAIQIMTQIFNLNTDEQTIISQQIDFLIDHNRIKKVKFLVNVKNFVCELFVKKFL